MIIKEVNSDNNNTGISYEYKRESSLIIGRSQKPVWFLFSGLGSQWTAMAKSLMSIDIFAQKIKECSEILMEYGIDLNYLLLSEDKNSMQDMTSKFVATTAIQIALFELLRNLDITPDGIIGHSFGEIACAYADNCLTVKQALLTSYWRGKVMENNSKIPKGLMAAIGVSWGDAKIMCPKGVLPVCHNSADSTTISGEHNR
jgi:fatty acid synthase, animal type